MNPIPVSSEKYPSSVVPYPLNHGRKMEKWFCAGKGRKATEGRGERSGDESWRREGRAKRAAGWDITVRAIEIVECEKAMRR